MNIEEVMTFDTEDASTSSRPGCLTLRSQSQTPTR